MTTLVLSRPAGSRLKALFTRVSELLAGVQEGLAMAREYNELSRLTPAELDRLGIERADIPRVVARRLLKS
jgi:uncharacterized protein YjiS (DUF1127 family)